MGYETGQWIIILSLFGLYAAAATVSMVLDARRDKRVQEAIERGPDRQGSGYVLRRARATEHFCRPPDTDGVVGEGGRIRIYDARTARKIWTDGDLWMCDCGQAWTVSSAYGAGDPQWVRSPTDDIDHVEAT